MKKQVIVIALLLSFTGILRAQLIKFNPLLSQGYLVLSEKTQKGVDINSYRVEVDNLPSGLLINNFSFKDGSVLSVNIIKE